MTYINVQRTALTQPAAATDLVCAEDACAARDGEEPLAVNVMREFNVVYPHVPNAACTT